MIYARFLTSHLPEPEQTISGWAKELEPGGLLLVEEMDSISTNVAAFDEYLKIVSEMLVKSIGMALLPVLDRHKHVSSF